LAIRRQISQELARQLSAPEIKEKLQSLGFNVAPVGPEEHEKNLRADLDAFARIVKEAGLKPK
jgi:tripartite-type tricarboxylate transporter receptor subunit TctC